MGDFFINQYLAFLIIEISLWFDLSSDNVQGITVVIHNFVCRPNLCGMSGTASRSLLNKRQHGEPKTTRKPMRTKSNRRLLLSFFQKTACHARADVAELTRNDVLSPFNIDRLHRELHVGINHHDPGYTRNKSPAPNTPGLERFYGSSTVAGVVVVATDEGCEYVLRCHCDPRRRGF